MAKIKKIVKVPSVVKDLKKLEPSCVAIKWYNHFGK